MTGPRESADGLTVLYVTGWVHSGSTILGNILGEIDGFFSAGEVRHLWRDAATDRKGCGCGAPLLACPLWQAVFDRAFGGHERVDFERLAALDHELLLNRRFLRLIPGAGAKHTALDEYLEVLGRLYAGIQEVTGCRVVVDTSKSPLYGLLVGRLERVDLRVVQLLRDPRGWMYSRVVRRDRDIGWVTGLLLFDLWHAVAEARWRKHDHYLRVRYEDFARRPVETARALARLAGARDAQLPFLDERHVLLQGNHNVNGNRNRSVTGPVEIRPDVRWQRELRFGLRALGAAVAGPMLLRHGYVPRRRSKQTDERGLVFVEHPR